MIGDIRGFRVGRLHVIGGVLQRHEAVHVVGWGVGNFRIGPTPWHKLFWATILKTAWWNTTTKKQPTLKCHYLCLHLLYISIPYVYISLYLSSGVSTRNFLHNQVEKFCMAILMVMHKDFFGIINSMKSYHPFLHNQLEKFCMAILWVMHKEIF